MAVTHTAPSRVAKPQPYGWTNWVGLMIPSSTGFDGGIGNAPNLNGNIGGGPRGAAHEKKVGHGLCGDIGERRAFTAGGKWGATAARGTYVAGGVMDVEVKLTAWHGGWFEFRLCVPRDGGADKSVPETQECFNQHVLKVHESTPGYGQVNGHGKHRLDYQGIAPGVRCKSSSGHPDPTSKTVNKDWPKGSCCNQGGACSPPTANTDRWIVPASSAQSYKVRRSQLCAVQS